MSLFQFVTSYFNLVPWCVYVYCMYYNSHNDKTNLSPSDFVSTLLTAREINAIIQNAN